MMRENVLVTSLEGERIDRHYYAIAVHSLVQFTDQDRLNSQK